MQDNLINLVAIGLSLAFVFGIIAQKLRLSPIVGYLLAGIVAGPFTPGFVGDPGIAKQLIEIGVILLMFGVGLHFSLKDLSAVKWTVVPGAIIQIILCTLAGTGFGLLLDWSVLHSVVFGFSMSMASTVVVLRALEDRRLLDTPRGKLVLGWLIVEDLCSVLALVMLPIVAQIFSDRPDVEPLSIQQILKSIGFTFLKLGLFVATMLVVGKRLIPWVLEKVASTGSRELFTLSVLAIALGVALGAAKLFDVSFALGAFFAGMILNESEFSHQAASDSLPLRDAFAVLFFVAIGMSFDPAILINEALGVLGTAAIIIGVKTLGAYCILRVMKKPALKARTLGASLAQIGEFSFVIIAAALPLGAITPEAQNYILGGALISIVVNPIVFAFVVDRWEHSHQMQTVEEENLDLPEGPTFTPGNHAIVIGYGAVGIELTRVLHSDQVPTVVIANNAEHVIHAHDEGVPAIRGNAASDLVLAEAHPESARIAIITIPMAFEAGSILLKLRELNPQITLLARAHSESEMKYMLENGADAVLLEGVELAQSFVDMVRATRIYHPSEHNPVHVLPA